jgi:cation diffusion facilitator CzcD-associated flavoprotein CzcO
MPDGDSKPHKIMNQKIETIIIGGGQAGLATSYYLTRNGREHIVLEKIEVLLPDKIVR